jgi:ubiquinone/menaquinone biosynthesis C-methylase UbiE
MVKPRVVEDGNGIAGEELIEAYDRSMRGLMNQGKLQTESLLRSRIDLGCAMEIGSGPGYEGLEWLKRTEDTTLKGLDISEDMVVLAKKNAKDYGLEARAEYYVGDATRIPFLDDHFDAVFSTNSLHEWANPKKVFNEIYRVLRPGGKYFISDLRRDMNPVVKWFIIFSLSGEPKMMRQRLSSAINASYTHREVKEMLDQTKLPGWKVEQTSLYVVISGKKDYNP